MGINFLSFTFRWIRIAFIVAIGNLISVFGIAQNNFIDVPPKPEATQQTYADSSGEVRLDLAGLPGLHKEFERDAKAYFEQALQCIADQGKWPTRKDYTLFKFQGKDTVPSGGNDFPFKIRIDQTLNIPIEVLILPDPEIVRACGIVERDFKQLEASSSIHYPEDWRSSKIGWEESLTGEAFFVPFADFPIEVIPTPKNTPSLKKNYPYSGRQQDSVSVEDFNHFPKYRHNRDLANWQGILVTDSVFEENFVVRWASLRIINEPEIKTWIAYAVVDACGGLSEDLGEPYDIYDTFIRHFYAPFKLSFKTNLEGLLKRYATVASEYNLLQLPTPQRWLNKEKMFKWSSADWTLCEQYYSEHSKPIWKLTVEPDSPPFRERFHIRHALDESGERDEVWKLIAFTTVKPKDLVASLAKLKGVDPATISLDKLNIAYEKLSETRNSILNK